MAKLKKKLLPSSLIVTQSNHLVEARYNLSLGEQRLILAMIAKIQPDDEDFKPYRISIGELADFLCIAKGSAYHECKKITKSLLGRVLEITETGRLLQTHWVSSADYIDGTGMVNLSFDPLLKPYLLQIKGNFTSCKFEILLSFKSQYTMRMYTLLKQYERLKEREIELGQLREMLGLRNTQYEYYNDFKRTILEPSQKELAGKADFYFEFDEIKYGRRVGAIRFRIFTKKPIESTSTKALTNVANIATYLPSLEAKTSPLPSQLLFLVPEQHQAKKTVQVALESFEKKHGFDYVKRNILYSNAKAAKSYAGFLNNALKEDWGHDWELEQQEVPVKKKGMEIWERQGFSSQKEYDDVMYKKQMEAYGNR
jgi:plasmid replication initiation protein